MPYSSIRETYQALGTVRDGMKVSDDGIKASDVRLALDLPDLGPVEMTARVVAPDEPEPGVPLLFCVPGMSYGKEYWDLPLDGYSFARAAAAAGHVVVAVDNVGTGASGRPAEADAVTLAAMAGANAALAEEVLARLAAGDLVPELGPLELGRPIGIGHSLGGCLVLLQQAASATFAAIAIFGFSNQPLAGIYEDHEREAELTDAERFAWATEHLPPKLWGRPWEELEPYFELPRENFGELFYAPGTPAAVIAADTALATTVPRTAAIETTIPRVSAAAAAAIDVPVLLAYGATDLSPDPDAEPATYPAAPAVELLRLEGSAHCHNVSTDRELLWGRLLDWARETAASDGPGAVAR
jgi:alpha-beta hydrolase superfamily lysophospholipase